MNKNESVVLMRRWGSYICLTTKMQTRNTQTLVKRKQKESKIEKRVYKSNEMQKTVSSK